MLLCYSSFFGWLIAPEAITALGYDLKPCAIEYSHRQLLNLMGNSWHSSQYQIGVLTQLGVISLMARILDSPGFDLEALAAARGIRVDDDTDDREDSTILLVCWLGSSVHNYKLGVDEGRGRRCGWWKRGCKDGDDGFGRQDVRVDLPICPTCWYGVGDDASCHLYG
jgi:hypothetical protein